MAGVFPLNFAYVAEGIVYLDCFSTSFSSHLVFDFTVLSLNGSLKANNPYLPHSHLCNSSFSLYLYVATFPWSPAAVLHLSTFLILLLLEKLFYSSIT